MQRMHGVHDSNASQDSLVSQFETTMTINPTAKDYEDAENNDISINHTVLSNCSRIQSTVDIAELEELEYLLEQTPKFKSRNRYSLVLSETLRAYSEYTANSKSVDSDSSKLFSTAQDTCDSKTDDQNQLDEAKKKYLAMLCPSPLIDESLTTFHKVFLVFMASNAHIERELPRFSREGDRTLVVLSPYLAEHAFGRKWVSKLYLSTIFERPQRLLASCLGVAAALTMFPFFYRVINSNKRGSVLSSAIGKIHGKNWPKKLVELCFQSHEKLSKNRLEVPQDWNTGDIYLTPKTINAVEGVIGTIENTIDMLYDPIAASLAIDPAHEAKGPRNAPENVIETYNLAFVVIRPPGHHSHACLPSGFCLLNNVQIGIEYANEKYGVTHVAILDIDLHHGDGSQDICWERGGYSGDFGQEADDEGPDRQLNVRDEYGKRKATYPHVGYFSLHDIKSYPTELGYATKDNIRNASTCIMDHDVNIWNVHLQEWSNEDEFYKHYQTRYVAILNRANQFLNTSKKQYEIEYQQFTNQLLRYNKYVKNPHLYPEPVLKPVPPPAFKPLITISAGFDASEYENPQMQRHGINVPTSFYARFTKDVVKLARIHTGGKVLSFMEGGYADGALLTGIFLHLVGLNNSEETLWNNLWGSELVMRELVKGCRKNWSPSKNAQLDMAVWANEVIKLGRAMMPNAILPANYIYEYSEPIYGPLRRNRMIQSLTLGPALQPRGTPNADSPIKTDPQDDRKVMRHTRSYYKKSHAPVLGT